MSNTIPPSLASFNQFGSKVIALTLAEDGAYLLDQTRLPAQTHYVRIQSSAAMARAIQDMLVRGAPAIGIAAAYGVVLACRESLANKSTLQETIQAIKQASEALAGTRPTAVNLFWALKEMEHCLNDVLSKETDHDSHTTARLLEALTTHALALHQADVEACYSIGEHGSKLLNKTGTGILTHCNAGALATGGYGTALGVVRSAFSKDSTLRVYASETRPRQQGARLTTWELLEDGIPVTLITDGMSGSLMQAGKVDMVVVGADRIASNGDVANKIGTYNLAIIAKAHNIPFYVAAPYSTFDTSIQAGSDIPIEFRSETEVSIIDNTEICHPQTSCYNPGFDITPAQYISGIITEKEILTAPYNNVIKKEIILTR